MMTTLTFRIRLVFVVNKCFKYRRVCMAVKLFYALNRFRLMIYVWCSRFLGRGFVALRRVCSISFYYNTSAAVVSVQTRNGAKVVGFTVFSRCLFSQWLCRDESMPTKSLCRHPRATIGLAKNTTRRRCLNLSKGNVGGDRIVIPGIPRHWRETRP